MKPMFLAVVSLAVCGALLAQQPGSAPAAPVKGDEIRRAFVDADGGRRIALVAAADRVLEGDAATRTKFMTTLRAVTAAAPAKTAAPASTPPASTPPAGTPPAGESPAATPPPAEKPVEFPEAVRATMAAAVAGPADATSAALAKLAADAEHGPAALARLAERGRAILARCLASTLRKRMETNALFAGQYADLSAYEPEAVDVLLAWVKEPPRDAPQPDAFRSACIRALRDLVPTAEATDTLRDAMKATLAKAQQTRNENLFVTAVCALHQFGEPAPFEATKADVAKSAASDQEPVKLSALSTLADLHYQLREYEAAANYYKELVAIVEKSPTPPPNLPTMIYNAACSLSLANKLDDGFVMLEKALQAGAKERAISKPMIDSDHDMNNLRADPRFAKLMEQHFGPKKDAPK